ncbi:PAS domain S-box protein [Aureibaculum algae]|uniref:histidine kinase n=1 Tax=Aureibaculum algae TaxID=2584122 RepID=A0A5B7TPB7_9FLAO|nr:PAS domain S-box protein [Aureibaculum algae]QCX38585.1 PAS domain S-box protein [Aureibaculum algae]
MVIDELENNVILQSVFNASFEGILVIDADGMIHKANQAIETMFGYATNKLQEKNIEALIPETLKLKNEYSYTTNTLELKKKCFGKDFDVFGVKYDGTKFPIEININSVNIDGKQMLILFIIDISKNILEKYKITKQKLVTKEAQNKAILDTLPDLMILYDSDGNHLEIHAPKKNQLVAPYDEHIGKNIDTLLPKKVCHKIRKAFSNCKKTKETQFVEYSLIINGELKHLESRVVQTDDGDYLSIIRDITKSKNAEKIIKESEERKRLALEVGEFGSWDWNLITNRIVRDTYQSYLLGLKEHEKVITFESFLEKIYPEDRENVKLVVTDAIKNKKNYTIEYRIVHPDKSVHWLHEKGSLFTTIDGIPERVIGVTNDISERKKAEQKLIESEKELRNLTVQLEEKVAERTKELTSTVQKLVESNLSLGDQIQITQSAESKTLSSRILLSNIAQNFPKGFVVVVDSNLKIVFIEGEELDDLGFREIVKIGDTIGNVQIVPQEVSTKVKNHIVKTLKGEHCSFEVVFQDRSYMVNTTPLINIDKKIEEVLLVYNNISYQKEIEIEILNTLKKEKELSELKSRFISMASHEFRTPLSAILSSAILIEKLNAPGYEDRRLNYVSKIRASVKNLVVILNDFLSLSKLQEGKVVAEPVSFDFIEFSTSLIEEIEGIKKNGQTIILKHQKPSIEVFLDQKFLKHIVFNLLSNAIKYSQEHKEIIFNIATEKQRLLFEITDQGVGIPEEDQTNLFKRFFRAKNTTHIEGTGLGLNIVKSYIELMGGTISLKSDLNIGTTFYVELPLKNEKK